MLPPGAHQNMFGVEAHTPLYRIFPLVRAMELFTTGRNTLVHPSLWQDPWEQLFLNAEVLDRRAQPVDTKPHVSAWYAQCWTLTAESDAMWRIYSHNTDGICVSTTVEKLFGTLYNTNDDSAAGKYFVGKVSYGPIEDMLQNSNPNELYGQKFAGHNSAFAKILLRKRDSFAHEQEVRVIFHDAHGDYTGEKLARFAFQPNDVIDDIVLDPRLPQDIVKVYMEVFNAIGCTRPIRRSSLYQVPKLGVMLDD